MSDKTKETLATIVIGLAFCAITGIVYVILESIAPAAPDMISLAMSVFAAMLIVLSILSATQGGAGSTNFFDGSNVAENLMPVIVLTDLSQLPEISRKLKSMNMIPVQVLA